ncbi:prephenate dehydrogenase [Piscinibacterium candidicorallinum]|uniref:prephenate dehydrogenase n=1 Tax=Piscinibacterium candidicorallinum TaxID=1793872 RepID=UPI00366B2933
MSGSSLPESPRWRRVGIVGVGLIGGSVGAALRANGLADHVHGVEPAAASRELALARGLVDTVSEDPSSLRDCDLVILAAPVLRNAALLERVSDWLGMGAVFTDVGSTKAGFCASARRLLSAYELKRFVPAHPIAGSDASGPAAATVDLFAGRTTVLCPLAETDGRVAARVEALWTAMGSRVVQMPADEHDAVFAAVSHLPHLLAFAAMNQLIDHPSGRTALGFAGPGFRDFSRIAGGEPQLWTEALLANRAEVLAWLSGFEAQLEQARSLIAQGDDRALREWIAAASDARRAAHTQLN